MATLNKIFPFLTTVEGFTGYPGEADAILSYDSAVGNPLGSLKSTITGRNSTGTSYWEWTGTWEDLGVPSGDTITQVRINDADNRCTEWTGTIAGCTIGPISIYDSIGDTLITTLWAGRSPTGVEGSWTAIGNQTYQAIGAPYQASGTTIRIRLYNTLSLGNDPAAVLTIYDDTISLDVDHEGGDDDLDAVGITATPVLGIPTIEQIHVLDAVGITTTPVLGIPTLSGPPVDLTAVGITTTPVLGTPPLAQKALYTITVGSDDAEQQMDDNGVSLSSSDLEFNYDDGSSLVAQTIGIRFLISIPQGANILSAIVTFKADGDESGTLNFTIKGEKSINSLTFLTDTNNITDRTQTDAGVAWSPEAWVDLQDHYTPDLKTIVQELVNQSGWTTTSAVTIIVPPDTGTLFRRAHAVDGAIGAPTLTVEYEESTGDDLTATSITTTPVLGTPSMGQEHAVIATGITVNPVLDTPALGQEHSLTASDISTIPVLGTPSMGQEHAVIATGITANPVLDTPALGQEHSLTASDISTTPVLGTPTASTQGEDALDAIGITTTPVLDTLDLGQEHVLSASGIIAAPVLGTPLLSTEGEDNLVALDITTTPIFGTPELGQTHVLSATDISTTPTVDTPILTIIYHLDATEITVTPVLDTPTLGQIHSLTTSGISTTPVLDTPELSSIYALTANGIVTIPEMGIPGIGQIHILGGMDILVQPILGVPTLGMTYVLTAQGILATPTLDIPGMNTVLIEYPPDILFSAVYPTAEVNAVYPTAEVNAVYPDIEISVITEV